MAERQDVIREVAGRFGSEAVTPQATADGIATFWTTTTRAKEILRYLKCEAESPYLMLYDLTAIDERERTNRQGT